MRSLLFLSLLSLLFLLTSAQSGRRRGGFREREFERLAKAVAERLESTDRLGPLISALNANTKIMGRLLIQAEAGNTTKRLSNIERRLRKTVTVSQQTAWSIKVVRMLGPTLKRLGAANKRLENAVNELRNRTGLPPLPPMPAVNRTTRPQNVTRNDTKCLPTAKSGCARLLTRKENFYRSLKTCKATYNGRLVFIRSKEDAAKIRKAFLNNTLGAWGAWFLPRKRPMLSLCYAMIFKGGITRKPCSLKLPALCADNSFKKKDRGARSRKSVVLLEDGE